ncbi:MAG TPA: BA14K family protein [Phenylobacterium sp.]|nr:BA14K family protein [Phenylobacterium sp.]
MRKSLTVVVASVVSLIAADVAVAQPRPYNDAWRQQNQFPPRPHDGVPPGHDRHGGPPGQQMQNYYYNGRWVGADEWNRRSYERDRWAHNYQRRRHRNDDNSSALIAGIIGFALGAAIVGSQQQAEHARSADQSWDDYCARKYRSYDRRSRTYMGLDGLRHYCQ